MDYRELIEKALQGRSVNKTAKDWGIPQPTLDRYLKGRLPDFQTALMIAKDAGVDPATVMRICAIEEAAKKPRGLFKDMDFATLQEKISINFETLLRRLSPRQIRISARS